ncbi:hypothetical protein IL306_001346 [Fusarium sp. DS 682]|nr:hypothetical protein IL306_001346 [Fusarium sp. DS 682]
MTIILLADDFDVRMVDMGKMTALLTLTGKEVGLSQPLTFESIKDKVEKYVSETTVQLRLSTAIEFVMAQQEREAAFFGPQPDPVESINDLEYSYSLSGKLKDIQAVTNQLGWTGDPIEGPSSTWVDPEVYTEWLGCAAREDWNVYEREEKRQRWSILLRSVGLEHTSLIDIKR